MKSLVTTSLAVASVVLSAGCTDHSTDQAAACNTFSTTLTVQDRMSQSVNVFNPNEPITFELTITNTTNAPATLTASSSCTAVTFEVFDAAKQRRWGSADGIACIQVLQPRMYAPLETVTESATWDQRDTGGAPVSAGAYTVSANVGQYASGPGGELEDCRVALSKSEAFTIQ
jgi:hypothetical protein